MSLEKGNMYVFKINLIYNILLKKLEYEPVIILYAKFEKYLITFLT